MKKSNGQNVGKHIKSRIPEEIKQKKEDEKRSFTYEEVDLEEIIGSTSLRKDLAGCSEKTVGLIIRILDSAGKEFAERAEGLYDPEWKRMGISWGADATWADVDGLEEGIEMWLNDGEEWERRN